MLGEMVASGAAILDIGGESTRPGASPVSVNEEMDRVLPLVARIAAELETVISVDTSTPALMREAAACGRRSVERRPCAHARRGPGGRRCSERAYLFDAYAGRARQHAGCSAL